MLGDRSYWKSPSTRYGAGQKRALNRKAELGIDPRVFVNKDAPDYKPNYGSKFTERQQMILSEQIPLNQFRLNEITIILHKAEELGDEEKIKKAKALQDLKRHEGLYRVKMRPGEARASLQALTPWKIDW